MYLLQESSFKIQSFYLTFPPFLLFLLLPYLPLYLIFFFRSYVLFLFSLLYVEVYEVGIVRCTKEDQRIDTQSHRILHRYALLYRVLRTCAYLYDWLSLHEISNETSILLASIRTSSFQMIRGVFKTRC